MKIIINACFGGFGISDEAAEWLIKNKRWKVTGYNKDGDYNNSKADLLLTDNPKIFGKYWPVKDKMELRINKDLIECIKTIGNKANGTYAELKIINIPNDIEWKVDEYDGIESIHEKHRSWS